MLEVRFYLLTSKMFLMILHILTTSALLFYSCVVSDHMLSVAEIEFMEHTLKRGTPQQCHYVQAGGYYRNCDGLIAEQDPTKAKYALWHAGGNWGDLWRSAQDVRIDSFQTLLLQNYTIIGMPQSFYYTETSLEQRDANNLMVKISIGLGLLGGSQEPDYGTADGNSIKMAAEIFKDPKHLELAQKRVILTWREKESYERALKWYPFARNAIVPDIAFQLGPYDRINSHDEKNVDVLVFLRDDKESLVDSKRRDDFVQSVLSEAAGKPLASMVVDWSNRLQIFDTTDDFFTQTSIELLSLGRVVVCDRLHAAILSYLAGIPFVYIDQISGKVSKTLNVAFDGLPDCQNGKKGMWTSASTLEEALQKAVQMMNVNNLGHTTPTSGLLSGLRNFLNIKP